MSLKMMPPKKSKAARSECEEKPEREPEPLSDRAESPKEKQDEVDRDEPLTGLPPKKKPFNVFDIIIVDGKRKRPVIHTPETALDTWCAEHLMDKEAVRLPLTELYNVYLDKCMSDFATAVEPFFFNKILRKKFPDGFAFKPSSPHLNKIKEKKMPKKGEHKVKADTLTLKIRDIIHNSLTDMGNPRGGVRFNRILSFIAGKYPALRLDVRPKVLLSALQRGVKYGYLTCDRGIGKCGFYRLYVENEVDEPEKPKENGKVKDEKDKDDMDKDDKDTDGEKEGEKSAEDSADDSKPKEEGADGEKSEKGTKKEKRKPAKKRTPKDRFIHHGDPTRLEDTFYLAMTFMSEPKEASVIRIKKYVAENYPDTNVDRLAKCLETGKERGYWEQVSGTSGSSGRFRLEVDSFDPTDDEDMTGMVINAIMACTEPKICSSNLLKKYVMEWYADKFKVAERPHLFKKALERAVANQEIRQLSGIGASGTFQLVKTFHPSPVILAGQDTTSDYDEVEDDTSDEDAIESYDFAGYGDKYKPRPSKRRGMARSKAVSAKPAIEINEDRAQKRKRKVVKRVMKKTHRRGESDSDDSSSDESSDESSSESEPEAPPPKKNRAAGGRGKAAVPAKKVAVKKVPAKKTVAKKIPAKKTPVKRTPAKRGHVTATSDSSDDEKATTPSRNRAAKRPNYAADSSDDDSEVGPKMSDGYKPTPSRSRGGGSARPDPSPAPKKAAARKSTSKKSGKKPQPKDEEMELVPKPRVRTPAAKKQGDDKMYSSDSDSMTSEINIPKIETLAAKKQRSAPAPKAKASHGKRRR